MSQHADAIGILHLMPPQEFEAFLRDLADAIARWREENPDHPDSPRVPLGHRFAVSSEPYWAYIRRDSTLDHHYIWTPRRSVRVE